MAFLAIGRSRELGRYPIGPYIGVLLGDVESVGMIEYGHVLDVFDPRTGRRVFAVAAERNQMASIRPGSGSHFICGYDGQSHLNYGSSDDWADKDRFLAKARELVYNHFGLPRDQQEQAIVPELARPSVLPAIPIEEDHEQPARPAGSPAVGMWLMLAGVVTVAVPTVIFSLPMVLPKEMYVSLQWASNLCGLVGRGLFVAGCFLAASRLPSRESFWLWPAGIVAAVSALLLVVSIGVHLADPQGPLVEVDRISSRGMFLVALLLHGAFLLQLGGRLGFNFHPRLVVLVMGGGAVLTVMVFFTTWANGYPPHLVSMGTLAGIAIWAVVQLVVTGKAVSHWGRQRTAD
jgi:hypothetical protein